MRHENCTILLYALGAKTDDICKTCKYKSVIQPKDLNRDNTLAYLRTLCIVRQSIIANYRTFCDKYSDKEAIKDLVWFPTFVLPIMKNNHNSLLIQKNDTFFNRFRMVDSDIKELCSYATKMLSVPEEHTKLYERFFNVGNIVTEKDLLNLSDEYHSKENSKQLLHGVYINGIETSKDIFADDDTLTNYVEIANRLKPDNIDGMSLEPDDIVIRDVIASHGRCDVIVDASSGNRKGIDEYLTSLKDNTGLQIDNVNLLCQGKHYSYSKDRLEGVLGQKVHMHLIHIDDIDSYVVDRLPKSDSSLSVIVSDNLMYSSAELLSSTKDKHVILVRPTLHDDTQHVSNDDVVVVDLSERFTGGFGYLIDMVNFINSRSCTLDNLLDAVSDFNKMHSHKTSDSCVRLQLNSILSNGTLTVSSDNTVHIALNSNSD